MRNSLVAAALSAVVFGTVGYATATTGPDSGGTFHGCVNKYSGALRVVAPDKACRRSENPVSWNQTGPTGPKGDDGATGAPGPASIDALDGSTCTRADGSTGTVAVVVGADDAISMTCGTHSTWCATHTPPDDVYLHEEVICDEATRTLTYICDDGWRDANDDHADGCEATVDPPTAVPLTNVTAQYLTLLVPDRPVSDVAVLPDCDASPPVECTTGVPDEDHVTLRVDSTEHAGDRPRAEAIPNAADKTFAVTQRVRVSTNDPIPVTMPVVGTCGLVVDSTRGNDPDVRLTYADTVAPDRPNGPTVVSSPPTVSGLESADVELTGGFGCIVGNAPVLATATSVLADAVATWVVQGATVCGAPEPVYYQRCSP